MEFYSLTFQNTCAYVCHVCTANCMAITEFNCSIKQQEKAGVLKLGYIEP